MLYLYDTFKTVNPLVKKTKTLFQYVRQKEEESATEENKRINSAYITT